MKPLFEFVSIDIHDIDTDDTRFKITKNHDINELVKCIRRFGLINPPLLLKKNKGFSIISGFRRVEALKHAKIETLHARVTDCREEMACAQVAVMDNSFQRPLTVAEHIKSVKLMAEFFSGHETNAEFFKTVCEVLNIPVNKSYVLKLWKVSTVSNCLMDLIENDRLSLDVVLDVLELDRESQKKLGLILNDYKISVSKQKELILLVREISVRDKCPVAKVLDDVASILNQWQHMGDMNARYGKVRAYLRQRRYPEMSHVLKKHEKLVATLSIPGGMKFTVPEFFEGSNYSIHLSFKNIMELNDLKKKFEQLCLSPEMEKILKKDYGS